MPEPDYKVYKLFATYHLHNPETKPISTCIAISQDFEVLHAIAGPRYIEDQECIFVSLDIRGPNEQAILPSALEYLADIAQVYGITLLPKSIEVRCVASEADAIIVPIDMRDVDMRILPLRELHIVLRSTIDRAITKFSTDRGISLLNDEFAWGQSSARRVFMGIVLEVCKTENGQVYIKIYRDHLSPQYLSLNMVSPATLQESFELALLD